MKIQRENVLFRAFLQSRDRDGRVPASESLLSKVEAAGCRGATALTGREGFLLDGPLLQRRLFAIGEDLPVIVEVIDTPQRIDDLARSAAGVLRGRLATLERAAILVFRRKGGGTPAARAPSQEPEAPMPDRTEGTLLRLFLDESDRGRGRPLYRDLLERAMEAGMDAGVVLRAPLGFGTRKSVHTDRFLVASHDLPVIVEVLGDEGRMAPFVAGLDEVLVEGIVTMEAVSVLRFPK